MNPKRPDIVAPPKRPQMGGVYIGGRLHDVYIASDANAYMDYLEERMAQVEQVRRLVDESHLLVCRVLSNSEVNTSDLSDPLSKASLNLCHALQLLLAPPEPNFAPSVKEKV